jgi:hypothetical protein
MTGVHFVALDGARSSERRTAESRDRRYRALRIGRCAGDLGA